MPKTPQKPRDPRRPLTGVQIPKLHPREQTFELLEIGDILFVFTECHVDRHIQALFTKDLPIRPERIYARTSDGVYELELRSFREVAHRLPSEIFLPAFTTLLVNIKKVKWIDRNGSKQGKEPKRTTLVKRLGFAVDPMDREDDGKEWIILSRGARQRITRYFASR